MTEETRTDDLDAQMRADIAAMRSDLRAMNAHLNRCPGALTYALMSLLAAFAGAMMGLSLL